MKPDICILQFSDYDSFKHLRGANINKWNVVAWVPIGHHRIRRMCLKICGRNMENISDFFLFYTNISQLADE